MLGHKLLPDATALSDREVLAISRAIAEPRRFELLKQIASKPSSACADLRSSCTITAPTLSHHLRELEACRLIEIVRHGKFADLIFRRDVWDAYTVKLSSL